MGALDASHRTYFHGGAADLTFENDLPTYTQMAEGVSPIDDTHFSAAFPSTTTGLWKVAVSTPIFRDGNPQNEVVGVLGLTVNLGDFAYFRLCSTFGSGQIQNQSRQDSVSGTARR